MPWSADDASGKTRKAKSPAAKKQWAATANAVLKRTGNEGSAVRIANAAVARRGGGYGPMGPQDYGGYVPLKRRRLPVDTTSHYMPAGAAVGSGGTNSGAGSLGGGGGAGGGGSPGGYVPSGKLTAASRAKIAPSNFALPGGRYPIHNESHARNALARVSQFGTGAEKAKVRAAVSRKYPGIEQSAGGYVHSPREGSAADRRIDAREAKKRGMTQRQWEGSAADERMDRAGGYAKNPLATMPNDARSHALTIASATHLHNAGHLPAMQKAKIHAKAKAGLAMLKAAAPAQRMMGPQPNFGGGSFGSLAPDEGEQM